MAMKDILGSRLRDHLRRAAHTAGVTETLGHRAYRVRGYTGNPMVPSSTAHEGYLNAYLASALQARPGWVIDVGVNLGQTLFKVLAHDSDRAYLGFEPQIDCCYFVGQFIRDNGLARCSVLPIALSDANGIRLLHRASAFDEMASFHEVSQGGTHLGEGNAQAVPVRVGDEVLAELGVEAVALVKIDVEGAENEVLRGLRGTLARQRPHVLFEVTPNFFGRTERVFFSDEVRARKRRDADEIRDLLLGAGYRLVQIGEDGVARPIEDFELDDPTRFAGICYAAEPR